MVILSATGQLSAGADGTKKGLGVARGSSATSATFGYVRVDVGLGLGLEQKPCKILHLGNSMVICSYSDW